MKKGNLVYLFRRNIKTTRSSEKLNVKKLGLFQVKRVIKDVSYELALPRTIKIHSVFYISLLEPAHPKTPIKSPPELHPETQKKEYEVEKILIVRKRRNQLQ